LKANTKREGLEWLKALGIGVILFVVIRTFLFSNYVVSGESMMPTLQDGNKLVVNKIGYEMGSLDRFDVIVFHANKKEDYVKRVIGVPGDTVKYSNDVLYVNGKAQKESYLQKYKEQLPKGEKLTGDFPATTVPKGKIFVLGDNRRVSMDSRYFGFVDEDKIVGNVDLRYWPLKEWDTKFLR
jgi:signal peptidase I